MKLFEPLMRAVSTVLWPVAGLWLHNSNRVRVLVVAGDKILLQRSSFGHQKWSLPGGGVTRREDTAKAAVREVEEEVGVTVLLSSLKKLGEFRQPTRGKWPMINVTFFEADILNEEKPKVTRPYEILEARWFSLGALPEQRSKTLDQAIKLKNGGGR